MKSSAPLLFAAAALSALAMLAAPASAKDKVAYVAYGDGQPVYYSDPGFSDEIIVIAPRGVEHRDTGRRSASGARIEELTVQHVVATDDLNLRYDSDVRELRRRIEATAVDSCREIDQQTLGAPETTQRQCINSATRDAMAQADILISNARG